MRIPFSLCASIVWIVFALASSEKALAHPLGNFTINHLARIDVRDGFLSARYVVDIAEIPTFQIMHAGAASSPRLDLDRWASDEAAVVADGFVITADGVRLPLAIVRKEARLRPGAGGLPTLYWVGDYRVALRPAHHHVEVRDTVYRDRRIGWKDIVVGSAAEPTRELLSYPSALLGSPRRISSVAFDVAPNGSIGSVIAREDAVPDVNGSSSVIRTNPLSDLFANPARSPVFIVLTLVTAFWLGALHAIEPGHGKALLAFTLVGSRATLKQAATLAASLTFAHTIGVFALGGVLFFAAGLAAESIYGWISLVSGAVVAAIGAQNLARYIQRHVPHEHAGHRHTHAIADSGPIGFRSAIAAAVSGGIAPCPAAIVVMLAALRMHQVGFGLFVIVIFSLGLASVLTALGFAVVRGAAFVSLTGRYERLVSAGPLLSAILISIVGAVMIGQGFIAQGVQAPVWLIAALTILAIAGYAASRQHTHAHVAGRA